MYSRAHWTLIALGSTLLPAATTFAQQDILIAVDSTWRYLDNGTDPGATWKNPDFPDGAWLAGPAELGYGDGDEATEVEFGPDSANKYITTYFRHHFNLAAPPALPFVRLGVLRDDGAIVYVNGIEVFRTNMPDDPVDYLTTASSAISGVDEETYYETFVSADLLHIGDNVVAVEIHQGSPGSSDISFNLQLDVPDFLPAVRGPYLQSGTPTSVEVCWRTLSATDSVVTYGQAPDMLTNQVTDAAAVTEHHVLLDELQADTVYYYAIGSSQNVLAGADPDHFFRTAPDSADGAMRVWAIGDSGTANSNAAAVRDAYLTFTAGQHTDVWLMLGDNAYASGTDEEYTAAVFDAYADLLRQTVVWPTLGNHDAVNADSPSESGVYYATFRLPRDAEAGGLASGTEAYYSFDYGNIHFVCLDSHGTDRSETGDMMTWLEADLADTLSEWVIAFWHHPPYTKGSHDSDDPKDSGGRLFDMRTIALPILENAGVDLVLCGHSHSYERSFLLNGHYETSDLLAAEMILDNGDGNEAGDGAYIKPPGSPAANDGTVYIVAGSSGKTSSIEPIHHPAMFVTLEELGSVVLDINGPRLDATFLRETGVVDDTFTILKQSSCPDLNGDQIIDAADLALLLGAWGTTQDDPDLNDNGVVNAADLALLLGAWGPC